ncbi:hypothetical protein CYMTET_18528 [Cymbomonas tetramitiformis]|uniref:Uncharacterized protein n=1 Tax=Cymbomonas tetramitiformis TaxID=36881 RepID=A0AAE0G7U5_9CHLO|nr:hypothetical protein CYMTET_18528 [Cymbomonas tetramitiformis]
MRHLRLLFAAFLAVYAATVPSMALHIPQFFASGSGITRPVKSRWPSTCNQVAKNFLSENVHVQGLFEHVPGSSPPREAHTWGSCALVGNSGLLLKAKPPYGSSIDDHSVVVRINQAPTNEYETYVGSKTTHRVLNNVWSTRYSQRNGAGGAKDRRIGPHVPRESGVTLVVSRLNDGVEGFQRLLLTNKAEHPQLKAIKLSRRAVRLAQDLLASFRTCQRKEHEVVYSDGGSPSSGLVALIMLSALCSQTTVFGMGVDGGEVIQEQQQNALERYEFLHSRW